MSILKRNIAPIAQEAWEEIDSRAKDVLTTYLSARKVVNVKGPKGLDYTVVPEGKLDLVSNNDSDVSHGVYKVQPLTEARIEFELNKWELDNIARGAKDIDFEPLEEAVKKAAIFEENSIYNGLQSSAIKGILTSDANDIISFGKDRESIMNAIAEGILMLKKGFVEKPYALVVGEEAWKRLNAETQGYPLIKQIEDLLGTEVGYSHVIDGALLLPYNHEDFEMTLGIDFSIGYQGINGNKIKFFITESFTFRLLDEEIVVKYKL